jgi:hypothetical protein
MRRVNRIATALVGLLLVGLGLLVALEVALIAAGRRPWPVPVDQWYASLRSTTLANRLVLVVAIAVAALGLIVLIAQLWPRRPDRLLTGDPDGVRWWVSRRSVERRTAAAAQSLVGVSRVRAAVRGREKQWRLNVFANAKDDERPAIEAAVRHELSRLAVADGVAVTVGLSHRRVT